MIQFLFKELVSLSLTKFWFSDKSLDSRVPSQKYSFQWEGRNCFNIFDRTKLIFDRKRNVLFSALLVTITCLAKKKYVKKRNWKRWPDLSSKQPLLETRNFLEYRDYICLWTTFYRMNTEKVNLNFIHRFPTIKGTFHAANFQDSTNISLKGRNKAAQLQCSK